jgi:hypothetical protein
VSSKTIVKVVGILSLIIAVVGWWLYALGFSDLRECKTDLLACEDRLSTLRGMIGATPSPIVLVTEVVTEVPVTVVVIRTVEVTRVVPPTPTPTPTTYPECSGSSSPPCIHVAGTEDSRWHLAELYLRDGCRWPEIMNLNRDADGYYLQIVPRDGYFIPLSPLGCEPSVLNSADSPEPIDPCVFNAQGRLLSPYPCVYTIPSDRPVYNGNYDQVAARFYAEISLGDDIRLANLESGCSGDGTTGGGLVPVDLGVRVTIVLPAPRR